MTPLAEAILSASGGISVCVYMVRQLVLGVLKSDERAEKREREAAEKQREKEEHERLTRDPAWIEAQRKKIATLRQLCEQRKAKLLEEYEEHLNKGTTAAVQLWNYMLKQDDQLAALAADEAKLVPTPPEENGPQDR